MIKEAKINSIIAKVLKCSTDDVSSANNLKEDLDMDSLHEVEIIMDMESEFSVTIPDDSYGGFTTADQFVNLLYDHE